MQHVPFENGNLYKKYINGTYTHWHILLKGA